MMDAEELKGQIATLEEEIEADKEELAEIDSKLGDEGNQNNQPSGEEQSAQPGENQENDPESDLAKLQARRSELQEDIVSKQAKVIALQKQLNDALANAPLAGQEE